MRTSLLTILAAGSLLTGCELITKFDDSLLDGGGTDTGTHTDVVHTDMGNPTDTGVDSGNPVDAADVVGTDAVDVVTADAVDVVGTDATDTGPVDTGVDAGVDAGVDTGPVDTGVDAGVDTGIVTDAGTDTGSGLSAINNCDPTTAIDDTGMSAVTITFTSFMYTPPCITVSAGTVVTFGPASGTDTFDTHPLEGATVVGGAPVMQTGTPIPTTTTGTTPVPVTFSTPGSWGFLCTNHYGAGMQGAVYVVP